LSTLIETFDEVMATLDQTVSDMVAEYAQHLSCQKGCASCCIDGFRIRYIEAVSVLKGFCELPPEVAQKVLARLEETDVGKGFEAEAKRNMKSLVYEANQRQQGTDVNTIQPCPLLNAEGGCGIYAQRPALCRAFGLILKANETLGCCSLNFQNIENLGGFKALDMAPYYEVLDDLSLKLWEAQPLNADPEPSRLSIRTYLKWLLKQDESL
jgi:Fe-S-cluster containining protein